MRRPAPEGRVFSLEVFRLVIELYERGRLIITLELTADLEDPREGVGRVIEDAPTLDDPGHLGRDGEWW